MKKTTLRDVAKEADVSVATVSYVLNNVSNQTIPEDTRQRVFNAASKLKYVQNLTAKALSLGKTNVLGILFVSNANSRIPKPISYGPFLHRLERRCQNKGYHLLVSQIDPLTPSYEIIQERKLDGAFLIDAMEESFHSISSNLQYGSPLVIVDAMINDSLFRSVNPDWETLFHELKAAGAGEQAYALIHEQASNLLYNQKIQSASGLDETCICAVTNDEDKLRTFIEGHADKHLIVVNEFLALQVMKYHSPEHMTVICTSECPEFLPEQVKKILLSRSKADAAFELMNELLQSPFSSSGDQSIAMRISE
ncbi:HTH-type transcriptional repressor PurR [Paenibacillus plantiphilus]|uniref:HTH-type transcriptional repressor PurR n=1 Tax=Paenibacillus plantiphilus TaxID=2905650 RepID=A0ABN8G3F3_9BACL|nr:LacI family DNA-binding transcriptional regulator [Paenibacillus plantiphilus]CAH1197916.1 HTH-type transcriptional repressor PurR [Paenibacillus plantiphilus]